MTIRCVRIPANGSRPRLVDLPTTYIREEGNEDSLLYHIPDLRPYWGMGDGWRYRDYRRINLDFPMSSPFRGLYYLSYFTAGLWMTFP
jgi:hypothetical protein